MNESSTKKHQIDRLVRTSILFTMTGLALVLLFLLAGFQAWSVGLGFFLGLPVMTIGVVLYITAVIRDLRHRRVLES